MINSNMSVYDSLCVYVDGAVGNALDKTGGWTIYEAAFWSVFVPVADAACRENVMYWTTHEAGRNDPDLHTLQGFLKEFQCSNPK